MLKTAMLVSTLALSAPVLAQDQKPAGRQPTTTTPAKPATTPVTDPMATTTTAEAPTVAAQDIPVTTPEATAPAETAAAPAPQTTPAMPVAPAETTTAPAAPAETAAAPANAATPVTGATQIAQVVNTEFPTYDKNADTNLDKTEFGAWMVALKSASDPATRATDPATVKFVDGAFASADTDKSKMVSRDELTKYLSQGAE